MGLWIVAAAEPTTAVRSSMAVLAILALVLFLRAAGSGKSRAGRRRRVTPATTLKAHAPRTMGSRRGVSRDEVVADELRMRQLERLREKGTLTDEEFIRTRDALRASQQ